MHADRQTARLPYAVAPPLGINIALVFSAIVHTNYMYLQGFTASTMLVSCICHVQSTHIHRKIRKMCYWSEPHIDHDNGHIEGDLLIHPFIHPSIYVSGMCGAFLHLNVYENTPIQSITRSVQHWLPASAWTKYADNQWRRYINMKPYML